METKMEHDMETGEIQGFRKLNLSYYIGGTILITIYIYTPIMVT